jgi:hypothetical protein
MAEYPQGATNLSTVKLERIGGVGGFGGPHLKSRGELPFAELSAADQAAVDTLFANKGKSKTRGTAPNPQMRDGFSYRLSRLTATGTETVEVPESMVPAKLLSSVKDSIE